MAQLLQEGKKPSMRCVGLCPGDMIGVLASFVGYLDAWGSNNNQRATGLLFGGIWGICVVLECS